MLNLVRAPLFVPGHKPDLFAKAAASGADAVILDLEDAVPLDAKVIAREALRSDFTDLPVIVRINPTGTPFHAADLDAVRDLGPDAMIVPKAEDACALAAIAAKTGVSVIALVETASGIAAARAIAAAKGVTRLAFGSIDYCADLGLAHLSYALLHARSELVLASRLAEIAAPIDGVTVQFDDPSFAASEAAEARSLGMTGKLCIHPSQVLGVLAAFLPSKAEIDWAHRVLATGDGAAVVDGAMVDEPLRRKARWILA
ncbi:MAG: citrate lyase subunit beta/citryl-CoA lyase [Akkermansiaceae bacterium]|jgi:citrate lyase subunit beta/citryl-CoA lyase